MRGAALAAALAAAALAAAAPRAAAAPASDAELVSWTRDLTRRLVRLDTSNPPGNELPAAKLLEGFLKESGISSEIYVSTGQRASLVARIKGDGSRRPLLLMCHTDVVPADPAGWSVPPFAAVEKDGYLYGRGAADVKSLCAAEAAVLVWLKRSGRRLARDVIFFAEADEETGGPQRHIEALLKDRPELVEAELGINEGGHLIWDGRPTQMRVQAAEKEYMDVRLRARGSAGHASTPRPDNAVYRLSRALARLSAHRFPARLGEVALATLRSRAAAEPALAEPVRRLLESPEGAARDAAADALAEAAPDLAAAVRDTLSPTMLRAGDKENSLPREASAVLNARLLPGRSPKDFLAELARIVDDPAVEISGDVPARAPSGPMPLNTPLWRAIEAAARARAPEAPPTPYLPPWSTDSQDLRARGVVMYGLDPPLAPGDDERVHGDDERIPLAGLDWYALFLRDVALGAAAREAP